MTCGVRDRRACPRTRRKGPTARPPQRPQQQQKLQQGAQQRAGTKNLRETNIELREENPKTSQENLINFCGARGSAVRFFFLNSSAPPRKVRFGLR